MVWTAYQQTIDTVEIFGDVEAETYEAALGKARMLYPCSSNAALGLARNKTNVPNAGARRMSLGWRYVNRAGRKKLIAEGWL
jgi:hypothetical protein